MAFVFNANNGTDGIELWISDGTVTGTTQLKNLTGDSTSSTPLGFYGFGGKIYFMAQGTTNEGRELWVTDGTVGGTRIVMNINPVSGAGSAPDPFIPFYSFATLNNKMLFGANGGTGKVGLWMSDGTNAGTTLVKAMGDGSSGSVPLNLVTLGSNVLFVVKTATQGFEVWKTNGTPDDTTILKDINPGPDGSGAAFLTVNGTKAFFSAYDPSNGGELWVTDGIDGTSAHTHLVKNINAGVNSESIHPDNIVPYKNGVLFSHLSSDNTAYHNAVAIQAYFTDGTTGNTVQLTNFNAVDGASFTNPQFYTAVGSKMVFSARNNAAGEELWITDGTPGGTKLLKNINTGTSSSSPEYFLSMGSKAVFAAYDTTHGKELWVTDGTDTGTKLLRDINLGNGSSNPYGMTLINGKVYFQAEAASGGKEMWVTDGTAAGTLPFKDLNPLGSSNPVFFYPFPNTAPTNITLTKTSVREFGATGLDVGILSATDAQGGAYTFTLLSNAGGRFKIAGNVLEVNNGLLLDYEQVKSHLVQVKVTDSGGLSFIKNFNLTLTDISPEVITGNSAANVFWGGAGADNFNGGAGSDSLKGFNGNDTLNGGLGNDALTGGLNNDTFVFNTALSSTLNKDTIADFGTTATNNDAIWLENAIFTKIHATSATNKVLLASEFYKSPDGMAANTPAGLNHRIIYETDTGLLRYDADGSKPGGVAPIIFADLAGGLALTNADFFVI